LRALCNERWLHANGDLYVVNGNYMHRLDAELRVLAERALPADRPYVSNPVVARVEVVSGSSIS